MTLQTGSNLYQNTKYVVGTGLPYTTIQSAINAAVAAGTPATIFVRAGAYTENLTLYDGIEVQGSNAFQTTITGIHVPPAAGRCALLNLGLISATHILSSAVAGTATIKFSQCAFNLTNGYVCNITNWTGAITFEFCSDTSTINGLVLNTATATVVMNNNTIGVGTANPMTINGILTVFNSSVGCPITLAGSAISTIDGGCVLSGAITLSATANLSIANSRISTGAATAITTTSAVAVNLSDVNINTSNVVAIGGTGTVNFNQVNFANSKGLAGTVVEGLAGVVKTGENYSNTILRMDMSGFYSWAAVGPYFDDTTLGTFQLLVGGTGYIRGKVITWVSQNISGMTSGATWYIYIDSTGTIGKTSTRTDDLFVDYIVLFECLYDETPVTKLQHTVKENHAYNYQVSVSNVEHHIIGTVVQNGGANITPLGAANVKVGISGDDVLQDHGLETTITTEASVTWKKFYTTAGGKWAVQNVSDTFAGYYNNAGTPTALGASKFGVYTLYASKDDLNTAVPIYYAVLDTSEYNNLGAATTAISNGTIAKATAELLDLELCQLGFIIWGQAAAAIVSTIIAKSTLRATISSGGGTNQANLVVTNTTGFNGILSGSDTNVQSALDTIDNWGAGTTDKCLVVGNGTGVALGVIAAGTDGTILTGNTSADPSWSANPTVSTIYATAFDTNVAAAGVTLSGTTLSADGSDADININITAKGTGKVIIDDLQLTTDLAVSEGGTGASTLTDHGVLLGSGTGAITSLGEASTGQILTGVTSSDPTWTTATYPATVAIGDVLVASAANVIGVATGGTTAGYVLTANGSGTAPTFQANPADGIVTLAGDSGTATGSTVTIAGGTNLTSVAGTATVTINLDADITMPNAGTIRTGTTAADTFLLRAYDVDGTAYKTFATLTANNTPTMDLDTDVTIGTAYIYRVGGTDVAVTDGGTGASTLTDHGILLGSGTGAITPLGEASNGQLPIGSAGADPVLATLTASTGITVANGAGSITLSSTSTTCNTQTDTYALVIGDAGKLIIMNKGTANTLTVPKNSAVAFATGTIVAVTQYGAGVTTIAPVDGDVTLRAPGSLLNLYTQYSSATLVKIGTDEWIVSGDLS